MSPRRAKVITGEGDPAERLREHLVETAAALVAARGTTAVTTREIARAAGVSDGVLYNYFADKNDLLVAGLVRRFEAVAARAGDDLPAAGAGTVEDNLVAYAETLYHLVRDSLPMIVGMVTDPALLHRLSDEIHRPGQGILPFLNRIGEYLTDEQRLGRIDAGVDLQATMLLLSGTAATLTMRSHLMLSADATSGTAPIADGEAHALLRRAVRILLTGIAGRQAGG